MEMKKSECEREAKEQEFNEDSIQSIMFTLGTFLLMVCLKSFLVEKWRSYVFLFLNVILLAILYMSMKPNYWSSRNLENESNVEDVKNDEKEKKMACEFFQEKEIEEDKECYKKQCWSSTSSSTSSIHHVDVENEIDEDDDEQEEDEHVEVLSKEELNERVEAFIAMFRKHLISDDKQGENFRHQKTSNLTTKIQVSCC